MEKGERWNTESGGGLDVVGTSRGGVVGREEDFSKEDKDVEGGEDVGDVVVLGLKIPKVEEQEARLEEKPLCGPDLIIELDFLGLTNAEVYSMIFPLDLDLLLWTSKLDLDWLCTRLILELRWNFPLSLDFW